MGAVIATQYGFVDKSGFPSQSKGGERKIEMKNKMKPASFTMPQQQLDWLSAESEKTGLHKVEILRRALDDYRCAQERKARLQMFTPAQRKDIKLIAEIKNISEIEVVREAVNRERRRVTEELKKRGPVVK